ncbi:MAG TPA: DUF4126 family protein [Thermoanaerobaculia bacterium]|nr:DUF4126 family protein [Thermoanaerobaculia bacterium]
MQSEPTLPTILLAAATGARTMTGLAATARVIRGGEPITAQPARFVASGSVASAIGALAAMELLADKLPGIPNRTDALPLLGRAAAGALIGATIAAASRRDRVQGAAIGAVVAVIAARLSFHARRALAEQLPATLAALVEDAAVGCIAAAGVAAMNR